MRELVRCTHVLQTSIGRTLRGSLRVDFIGVVSRISSSLTAIWRKPEDEMQLKARILEEP